MPTEAEKLAIKNMDFMLKPRQDLAVHRFNQYCPSKSILLVHGVGSGKTLTSLTMALNSFTWGEARSDPSRKIVVVAPSGVFKNFIDSLKNKYPNVTDRAEYKPDSPLPDGAEAYSFKYNGRPFYIYGYKYSHLSADLSMDDMDKVRQIFNESIVIFDEAHRLFRIIPQKAPKTVLNILSENNIMSGCKRFIAMTGTPYNSTISDILPMLRFIECSESSDPKCIEKSHFAERNYLSVIPGLGAEWTKRVDFWVFGFIKLLGNIIPDFISTDIAATFHGFRSWISKKKADHDRGVSIWNLIFGQKELVPELNQLKDELIRKFDERIQHGGQNYYDILGLDKNELALLNEEKRTEKIKKEYKKLATKYHPDKCEPKDKEFCTKAFIGIQEAYTYLINDKSINTIGIFRENLNKKQFSLFVDTMISFMGNRKYTEHLLNNMNGFIIIDEKFGTNKILGGYLSEISEIFKDQIPLIENVPSFVKKTCMDMSTKADSSYLLLKNIPIEDQVKRIETTRAKLLLTYKQSAGSWSDTRIIGPVIKYFGRDSGLGGVVKIALEKYLNLHEPINYKKLAINSLKYISIVDNDMPDIATSYSGLKFIKEIDQNVVGEGVHYPGQVNTTLGNINPVEISNPDSFRYPGKEVVVFYNRYSVQQLNYYQEMKMQSINQNWWATSLGNTRDIRNPQYRCVGNYSSDYDNYTAEYDFTKKENPDYKLIRKADEEKDVPFPKFDCSKFRRALQQLFIMKSGKMFSFENKLEDQPHLTVPDPKNIAAETQDYDPVPGVGKSDISYRGYIPKISYAEATYHFLPLVWSCGGKDGKAPGINLFAAFLNGLGLKYVVLHTDPRKFIEQKTKKEWKVSNKEQLRVINKIYPIIKEGRYLERLLHGVFRNIDSMDFYSAFEEILLDFPLLRKHPICALIDPEMTEGIDCKHNPAFLLLEPPNTLGDYEQLCGRVLRTYDQPYKIRPKKMIYQFACYDSTEIHSLFEKRFNYFKNRSDIEKQGLSLFYDSSGNVKTDLLAAVEMDKEYLAAYVPKTFMGWVNCRLLGGRAAEIPDFKKKWWAKTRALIGITTETESEQKAFAEIVKKYERNIDIGVSIFDTLWGTADYKLALINERNSSAVYGLNKFIKRYGDFTDKEMGKLDDGTPYTARENERAKEWMKKGLNAEFGLERAYEEISNNVLESDCPDMDRMIRLQAEEYQVRQFFKEFKGINPDLKQIKECVTKHTLKEQINMLPWCDPFIEPYEKNKGYICKTIDQIENVKVNRRYGPTKLLQLINTFLYSDEKKQEKDERRERSDIAKLLQHEYEQYKLGTNITINYKDDPGMGNKNRRWWLPNPDVEEVEEVQAEAEEEEEEEGEVEIPVLNVDPLSRTEKIKQINTILPIQMSAEITAAIVDAEEKNTAAEKASKRAKLAASKAAKALEEFQKCDELRIRSGETQRLSELAEAAAQKAVLEADAAILSAEEAIRSAERAERHENVVIAVSVLVSNSANRAQNNVAATGYPLHMSQAEILSQQLASTVLDIEAVQVIIEENSSSTRDVAKAKQILKISRKEAAIQKWTNALTDAEHSEQILKEALKRREQLKQTAETLKEQIRKLQPVKEVISRSSSRSKK